ncbi:InlB B-repeat-containing protein, partial [Candidatus Saccharibacteria bacterium]|nr:InlB B-repeat-containing protein [Candidatus Saccharibacteria bacterium]
YSSTDKIKRTGYTLKGWKIKVGNGTPSETTYSTTENMVLDDSETSEVTLIAQWEPNKYTIHYNSNAPSGTTASGTTADQTDQAYNTTTTLRANGFSITGYNFAGWAYTANGTKAFDSNQASVSIKTLAENAKPNSVVDTNNATINLYALWTKANYTLTVANGNTAAISSISPSAGGYSHTYGDSITVSCTPNSGYHCAGWTSSNTSLLPSSSNASYTFNMPAGAVTLTASGAANSFTIYYNSNGGSGSTASTTATYGQNVTLATNAFTAPSRKKFKSWGTSTSGGTTYSSGQSGISPITLKSNVTTVNGGSITLYAIWEDDGACYISASVGCKLADGHTWIYGNSGYTLQWTEINGKCPSGYSLPTKAVYDNLISKYSGGGLYNALHLSDLRGFWSSTENSSNGAYFMSVGSSDAYTSINLKAGSNWLLCYK